MKRMNCLVSGLAFALAVLVSVSALAADDYKSADALLAQIASAQNQSATAAPSSGAQWIAALYKGADALLTQIGAAKNQPESAGLSPAAQWLADITAFRKKAASLPPDEAARQWLDLVSRYAAFSAADLGALSDTSHIRMMMELAGQTLQDPLIGALPGPAAWPALAKAIDARPAQSVPRKVAFEAALHLLAHTLVGDPAGQRKAILALMDIKDSNIFMYIGGLDIPSLEEALADQSDDAGAAATAFEAKIARRKKLIENAAAGDRSASGYGDQSFEVPDLVTILGGEKQATPLVREAILLPVPDLTIAGAETTALARKLALEEVANLKTPRWDMACSLDGAPLYEALEKRFPDATLRANSGSYTNARRYYFLHLIVDGQTAKAVAMAEGMGGDNSSWIPVDELDAAGYTRQVYDFLHDLLAKHPELPFWEDYISLAAKTGQTSQMLDLIRSVASRTDLSASQRGNAHKSFYLALLAADQIDEGIAELRKVISAGGQGDDSALEKNVALARLGQLLERPDLLEEGIAGAKKHLLADPATESVSDTGALTSLAELLTQVGRGPEAEEILGQVLGRIATLDQGSSAKQECLAALVRLYYKAGRPNDVLTVLYKFPGWGAADLKDILTQDTEGFTIAEFSTHAAGDDYPVGYMAAWALAQTGQKEAALKIDSALLDQEGGFDPGFELLTKISGQGAIPQLDMLARRDRFEQRPLIWKAQLQLDAGKLDDAEKTIRAAITIDPSDGEQGPGRRMREYAVLADVLDKKGDKEHAAIYRGAVTAIRMSERADRFYEAGLLTRAVKMYEDALTHFADAYCIQSRLALRLSELGDNAGAEEHYRRAYELMPESFGRVESHCFGCERAFEGKEPQSIAEQVFTQLVAKMPENPQVHYLLGYLRYEQDRYREALPEFEEAVKLDPDYLNAWKKIGDLSDEMHLPVKLRNEVALKEALLDPLSRHGEQHVKDVTDLVGLWNAGVAAQKLQPAPPGPLLPLTASAAEMKAAAAGRNGDEDTESDNMSNLAIRREPIDFIAGNRFIAAVSQILRGMPELSTIPAPF